MKKKDGLSRSVYSRNAVPSNHPHQKGARTYRSTSESYQTMKEEATPLLCTLFQKTEERTHLIFYEVSITLSNKDRQTTYKYLFMNKNAKILKKILVNRTQPCRQQCVELAVPVHSCRQNYSKA